jgi:hypothetical protein
MPKDYQKKLYKVTDHKPLGSLKDDKMVGYPKAPTKGVKVKSADNYNTSWDKSNKGNTTKISTPKSVSPKSKK